MSSNEPPDDRDHVAMMSDPARWPHRSVLPLKRYRPAGQPPDLGVLVDPVDWLLEPRHRFTVFLVLLGDFPASRDDLLAAPREEFGSCEEAFAAGWRVD